MPTKSWVHLAVLPFLILGACASPAEDEWSPTLENLYSFTGEIPDGSAGESAEIGPQIRMQVQRIRRSIKDRSKYVLAQEPNPPQPCREWKFVVTFHKPGFGDEIGRLTASTDTDGLLRIQLPVRVREQGSKGVGVDVAVNAVLPKTGATGHLYQTASESEPRVRFDGGYLLTIPPKTLSDFWLRFGDREL